MKCTAHTRGSLGVAGSKRYSKRCERELGHPGLHRYYPNGSVQEFPDSMAWWPTYSLTTTEYREITAKEDSTNA